jgi:acyl-CoA synthetase (NDP forming)
VRLAVALGNSVDVTSTDVLTHLAGDAGVRAVALHVESVADGRALLAAVEPLADRVPVVALVVGRSDVGAFARSHTGALATSWRTTRAALRQAGAVLVDDERALVDAVRALSRTRLPASPAPGIGLVTGQAGSGLLLVDSLRSAGVDVPELDDDTVARSGTLLPPLTYQRNPVDTGRPDPRTLPEVVRAVAADRAVDAVGVYALLEPDAYDLPSSLPPSPAVPMVVVTGGPPTAVAETLARLERDGVPSYSTPASGVTALRSLVDDSRTAWLRAEPAAPLRGAARPPSSLDEDEAKGLLAAGGVPTLPQRACGDRSAAHAALAELGGPVVVKLRDADVLHKTEVGGVHLGVRTPAELDGALDALERAGARRVLVERMAAAGPELLLGARRDAVFGPVVVLGLGGTTAEALADVAVRLAPLSQRQAHSCSTTWTGAPWSRASAAAPPWTGRRSPTPSWPWPACSPPHPHCPSARSTRCASCRTAAWSRSTPSPAPSRRTSVPDHRNGFVPWSRRRRPGLRTARLLAGRAARRGAVAPRRRAPGPHRGGRRRHPG